MTTGVPFENDSVVLATGDPGSRSSLIHSRRVSATWLRLDLSAFNVRLTAGTQYAIVAMTNDSGGGTTDFLWALDTTASYTGGGSFIRGSNATNVPILTSWTARAWDLPFRTYIAHPVASAGLDQSVAEASSVTLDATASVAGTAAIYNWTQTAGPAVTLNLTDPIRPTFTAPSVPAGGATLTFSLTVVDGTLSSLSDAVNVTVSNVNKRPVADAGPDQTVNEGSGVILIGANSYDPDADSLLFSWIQTAGPVVSLIAPNSVGPKFFAPAVGSGGTLTFSSR